MRQALFLYCLWLPTVVQKGETADQLVNRARIYAQSIRSWQAEVIQSGILSGPGINLHDEIRTKVAAQPSLKMMRQNSGGDRTIMVCDGVQTFYSGDGNSYYREKEGAHATPQCDLPLIKFYEESLPTSASWSIIGADHLHLADGDRRCILVHATYIREAVKIVRTMCIEPSRPLILRDVVEATKEAEGLNALTTTTFVSFEVDPHFSPNTFRFTVPPGAVEATRP